MTGGMVAGASGLALPGARLYKRRLKSTKERIRITEVLPTRGPLFAFSLAFMGCAAGRSINTI